MDRKLYAILWGVAAVGIGFWINQLTKLAFSERLCVLLVAPVVEEIAKYLAIRQARNYSLLIPITFTVGEVFIQQVTPFNVVYVGAEKLLASVVLYVVLSCFMLRHFLLYIPVYLWGWRGLPVAIGLHGAWNLYMISEPGWEALAVIVVAAVLVPLALYKAKPVAEGWVFTAIGDWKQND